VAIEIPAKQQVRFQSPLLRDYLAIARCAQYVHNGVMGVIRRTNPSGKEIWGILWTDERGKHVRRYDKAWTKAQAQAALDEIERNLRMGVATHTDLTVADLFHEWHEHHVNVNCSPAYYEDSSTQFRFAHRANDRTSADQYGQ